MKQVQLWKLTRHQKMGKKPTLLMTVPLAVVIFIATSQPAYAYIDPGSGTFVLQILGMAIVSGLFFFRQIIFQTVNRLKTLREMLMGRSPNVPKNPDQPDQNKVDEN